MNSRTVVESLSPFDLRSATQQLVRRSHGVEAALLVHLGQIEERKLYLDWSFSSMFGYCVGELGFSEDVACNRISLARAARRMPIILDVVSSGKVHLAGLRLLAPHLTTANQEKVLAEAAGKSRRQIEELVARLAPQPTVRDGFARTHLHRADRIRLLCRAHNQHAAEQMYGRAFMERARASVDRFAASPGTASG